MEAEGVPGSAGAAACIAGAIEKTAANISVHPTTRETEGDNNKSMLKITSLQVDDVLYSY